nr:hypothetical protein [Tanacetum cinerariifolium]
MSDSDESGVTYRDISSRFEELSDIGSPRADDYEHLMLPEMLKDPYAEVALQAPPSPDYIPGPEEPEQVPPSPDYVLGPEHVDDEIIAKDQPYAEDASHIAQSPEFVPESDFEAHPEDDDDENPEEDPVDYLADGGDDGDDEEESSEDDEDDEMDIEADEEEEHPAPTDSVVIAPTAADQAPSTKETEPFETDESAATPPPHPAYRMTAGISIPAQVPMPAWTDSEVVRLLAISSPPASPLSPWSLPPPQIPFPPLPLILSPPLPRLDIALSPRYEVGESSSVAAARPAGGLRADYGFVATVDREIMHDPERGQMLEIRELQATDRRRQTDQPYAEDASPIALSHEYVPESDFEAHPEDDDDEDPEEDLAPVPMPAWTDSEVVRLLAISSPSASQLSPWSSPPPQIPFPPLPPILSPPSPVLSPAPPPSPIRSLGYRAAMIRLRDEAASTSHSPPLQLPSASRREDRPEVTLPPPKRLDIALGPRYEVEESSSATAARPAGGFRADYGFVATVDREIM